MDAIRIQNLRSLKDTDWFNILPVNLLLGRNSSGKSTFIRTFPLLRQSSEARKGGPILWFGNYVDFGSFNDALRCHAADRRIMLGFKACIPDTSRLVRPSKPRLEQLHQDAMFTIQIRTSDDGATTELESLNIEVKGHSIHLEIGADEFVTKITINGDASLVGSDAYAVLFGDQIIPHLVALVAPDSTSYRYSRKVSDNLRASVSEELAWAWDSAEELDRLIGELISLPILTQPELLALLRTLRPGAKWQAGVEIYYQDQARLSRLCNLIIALLTPDLLDVLNMTITEYVRKTYYFAPLRATAQRYYRSQELAADFVDQDGTNLSHVINGLSPAHRRSLNNWTSQYFGFEIHAVRHGGHISLEMSDGGRSRPFNLADVGFGVSQIIPIITQLWILIHQTRRRVRLVDKNPIITMAIEQPELHLHPELQAKVARMLIDSVTAAREAKIDLRLIVETHSETIINAFGEGVYQGAIDKSAVGVTIFEKNEEGISVLTRSEYDAHGILDNWPSGFFSPRMGKRVN